MSRKSCWLACARCFVVRSSLKGLTIVAVCVLQFTSSFCNVDKKLLQGVGIQTQMFAWILWKGGGVSNLLKVIPPPPLRVTKRLPLQARRRYPSGRPCLPVASRQGRAWAVCHRLRLAHIDRSDPCTHRRRRRATPPLLQSIQNRVLIPITVLLETQD